MPEDDYFPATMFFVEKYKKMPTPGPVPKNWLEFSCTPSEDCELYLNFDEIELKMKSDHTSKNKVK